MLARDLVARVCVSAHSVLSVPRGIRYRARCRYKHLSRDRQAEAAGERDLGSAHRAFFRERASVGASSRDLPHPPILVPPFNHHIRSVSVRLPVTAFVVGFFPRGPLVRHYCSSSIGGPSASTRIGHRVGSPACLLSESDEDVSTCCSYRPGAAPSSSPSVRALAPFGGSCPHPCL